MPDVNNTEPNYPEAPFSSTIKDARGDLHTFRGLDFDEWHANGSLLIGAERVEVIQEEIRHRIDTQPNKGAQIASNGTGQPPQGNDAGDGGSVPQNATQGQGDDWKAKAPYCAHGQRRPQEWTAKSGPNAGKPQYAYFCPQPREVPQSEKCTPIDAISGKEWGAK